LENAGISTPSSKSSSACEAVLRRELDAQKESSVVFHEHLEELKRKTKAIEKALERTASLHDKLKKKEEERHLMLQKLWHVTTSGISSQP
jgi:septal ring factor EnvC (AmiA/AmiB activator)